MYLSLAVRVIAAVTDLRSNNILDMENRWLANGGMGLGIIDRVVVGYLCVVMGYNGN